MKESNWIISKKVIENRVNVLKQLGFEDGGNGILIRKGDYESFGYVYSFSKDDPFNHYIEKWYVTKYDADFIKRMSYLEFIDNELLLA